MPTISKLVPRRATSARGQKPRNYPELNFQALSASLGITPTYVGRIMNGVSRPSMSVARRLANLLGWTLDQVDQLYANKTATVNKTTTTKTAKVKVKSKSKGSPWQKSKRS